MRFNVLAFWWVLNALTDAGDYFERLATVYSQHLMRMYVGHIRRKAKVVFEFLWIFGTIMLFFIHFLVINFRLFCILSWFNRNIIPFPVHTANNKGQIKIGLVELACDSTYMACIASRTSVSLLNVCEMIFFIPSLTLSTLSKPSTFGLTYLLNIGT